MELADLYACKCNQCGAEFNHGELEPAITDRTDAENRVCPECHSELWEYLELDCEGES